MSEFKEYYGLIDDHGDLIRIADTEAELVNWANSMGMEDFSIMSHSDAVALLKSMEAAADRSENDE